jgi:hypothetical protein
MDPFEKGEIRDRRSAMHQNGQDWSGVSDFRVLMSEILRSNDGGAIVTHVLAGKRKMESDGHVILSTRYRSTRMTRALHI